MIRAEKLTGTAGELFTAFELTMLGIECDLIKQDGTDVVAVKGDGVLLAQRIEVKTATSVDKKKCYCFSTSKGKPKRPYTKFDCDIIALVALPQRNIQFMSVESLPGLTKKEIAITRKQDVLTIRGDREIELEEGQEFKRQERKSGAFMRSFALPEGSDALKITATFRNGVLTVQLPLHHEDEQSTHIPVQ